MSDAPLGEPRDERETMDDPERRALDDPTTATNDSNVGTVAGTTGTTPLTGGQIVSRSTGDTDEVI